MFKCGTQQKLCLCKPWMETLNSLHRSWALCSLLKYSAHKPPHDQYSALKASPHFLFLTSHSLCFPFRQISSFASSSLWVFLLMYSLISIHSSRLIRLKVYSGFSTLQNYIHHTKPHTNSYFPLSLPWPSIWQPLIYFLTLYVFACSLSSHEQNQTICDSGSDFFVYCVFKVHSCYCKYQYCIPFHC